MTIRMKRIWLGITLAGAIVAVVALLAMPSELSTAITVYQQNGVKGIYARLKGYTGIPSVPWESAVPEDVGLSSDTLEELQVSLAAQGTQSLLIARKGRIVLEWYAPGNGPNRKYALSAGAKGVVAGVILAKALSDGEFGVDDRVAKYVPSWRSDPQKSKITIRHLATHFSGMDDVRLTKGQIGWKDIYVRNGDQRFRLALEQIPILHEPGSQRSYSGAGFYVLAYTIATALKDSTDPTDLKSFLRGRIMEQLGIPLNAWELSYGDSYDIDAMELYAIGSGASYTPRAAARIGQLFVQNGEWEGQQLIDSMWISQAIDPAFSRVHSTEPSTRLSVGLGWWVNSTGSFSSLPPDAAIAAGGSHRIVLVVPSLQLVAVRIGERLEGLGNDGDNYWQPVEDQLFSPLMSAFLSGH
jgi:CubicO group peptidase (beta-lactamase class C family)